MFALTLSLLLAVEPVPEVKRAQAELKLVAPGLTTSGLDAAFAAPLTDHLAKSFIGIRVVTPRDIAALLGLERQKQLMGCSDDSGSCMAELGNALGVQGVLLGDIVKLGKSIQINAHIIDPVSGKQLASASARVRSQDVVFEALTRAGNHLREQFLHAMGRGPPPGPAPVYPQEVIVGAGTRRFAFIPFGVGGVSLGLGISFLVLSELTWQRLTAGPVGSFSVDGAVRAANDGRTFQAAGATLVTVGLAAAVGGAAVWLLGSPSETDEPTAMLGLSATGAIFAGSF